MRTLKAIKKYKLIYVLEMYILIQFLLGLAPFIALSLGIIYLANRFNVVRLITGKTSIIILLIVSSYYSSTVSGLLSNLGFFIGFGLVITIAAILFSSFSMLIYSKFKINTFKNNFKKNLSSGMFIVFLSIFIFSIALNYLSNT